MIQITVKINENKIAGEFTDADMAKQFIDKVVGLKNERQLDKLDFAIQRAKLIDKSKAISLKEVQKLINA
ncbi:MAG: hypothetical protein LBF36_01070 [Mycoplasmataceae bacterium]|jgi:hypothetical protein|nr:hypothetical protein [Mycoplasmataceae bacterium]